MRYHVHRPTYHFDNIIIDKCADCIIAKVLDIFRLI